MPKKNTETIVKIEQNLFKDRDDFVVKMTDKEVEIMHRYQKIFSKWNDNPGFTDCELVDWVVGKCNITRMQAGRDIAVVERLLGSVKKSSKEWNRYRVTQMLLEDRARAIEKGNLMAAIKAAEAIGKVNKCEQVDGDDIDWSELEPINFEPSNDISVLDPKLFDADMDRKREALRAKFKAGIPLDTPYEMVKSDGE